MGRKQSTSSARRAKRSRKRGAANASVKPASTEPPESPETPTDEPIERLWKVNFVMSREVEIRGKVTAVEAEEKARDQVLFNDDPPIDRDDIDDVQVTWLDETLGQRHLPKCYGNHCYHWGCFEGDESQGAEDYHEYCANCDPD